LGPPAPKESTDPEGIDVSPDGTEVWVGCRGSSEIEVVRRMQTGQGPDGMAWIGRK
jgi:hypothetical protein